MSTKWPSIAAAAAICGRDQVGAPARALAALEVAVRGRGAALARREDVRVHARGTSSSPRSRHSKPARAEDLVEALRLGLRLDLLRSRARPSRAPPSATLRPVDDRGGRAQVLDARVRAGADEDAVERDLGRSACPARGPCRRGRARPLRGRPGTPAPPGRARRRSTSTTMPGFVPQVTCGEIAAASTSTSLVEARARVGRAARASASTAASKSAGAAGAAARRTRRSSRRGRSCPPGRRPRSSCCRPSSGPPSRAPRSRGRRTRRVADRRRRRRVWPIVARIRSLARDAGAELARVADPHRARPLLDQALGREHVLDLGGADPEGQRAEGAVGRGVAVAADDRHPRLGDAQLRARSRGRSPGGRSRGE